MTPILSGHWGSIETLINKSVENKEKAQQANWPVAGLGAEIPSAVRPQGLLVAERTTDKMLKSPWKADKGPKSMYE